GAKAEAMGNVGIAAQIGWMSGKEAFWELGAGGNRPSPAAGPRNGWGVSETPRRSVPGYYLTALEFPVDQFRIPPKELGEMLPQQSLMLRVAAEAIRDANWDPRMSLRTGVLVGIGLDLNTTNFHFRCSMADRAHDWARALGLDLSAEELTRWTEELREAAGPALTANRTMGSLGGLVASRSAREFRIGVHKFKVNWAAAVGVQCTATT